MASVRENLIRMATAAAVAVTAVGYTAPAMAQQISAPAAAAQQANPETVKIVNARLKELVPILKNAEAEQLKLGLSDAARNTCAAQTRIYTKATVALKDDPTYSEVIAKADMKDLETMTRFATCTLPGGVTAKLNVCSAYGIALSGKLSGPVFDPRMIDDRKLAERCPVPAGRNGP